MSDPFIPAALVPPGVNDQRGRDFAAALSDALSGFSTSSLLIQDPLTVPASFLPIMTVELGMTEFMTDGLREIHIRQLLARAPEIHAWTGTVYGTKRALGALGITVDWQQWWQMEPKGAHDTHYVVAYVNDHVIEGDSDLFSAETQYAVKRIIEATQRWSQEIAFLLGAGFKNSAALIGDVQNVVAIRPTMTSVTPMLAATIAPVTAICEVAAIRPTADVISAYPALSLAPVAALSNVQFAHFTMEVA